MSNSTQRTDVSNNETGQGQPGQGQPGQGQKSDQQNQGQRRDTGGGQHGSNPVEKQGNHQPGGADRAKSGSKSTSK